MSKKSMKKKNILIGCSIIFIFLLSFTFFKIFANSNINQDEKASSKTAAL